MWRSKFLINSTDADILVSRACHFNHLNSCNKGSLCAQTYNKNGLDGTIRSVVCSAYMPPLCMSGQIKHETKAPPWPPKWTKHRGQTKHRLTLKNICLFVALWMHITAVWWSFLKENTTLRGINLCIHISALPGFVMCKVRIRICQVKQRLL